MKNNTKLSKRVNNLLPDFICPECHSDNLLFQSEQQLFYCNDCHSSFKLQNGTPVLLSQQSKQELGYDTRTDTGQAMIQEYEAIRQDQLSKKSSWKQKLKNLITPPELMLHYNPDLSRPVTEKLFTHQGSTTCLLNVGGGPVRFSNQEITLNLQAFHNVDMVADAHNIPIADNTFDSVFSIAVLEHVPQPEKVIKEMIRTLKPGGYLYTEVPFIFFFHGYPNDYQRFTREGVRFLFRDLKDVEIGMTQGPVSAVLQSINMVCNLFLPEKQPVIRKIFNGLFRWLFFPLKYLDLLVKNKKDAHLLAGGFYIIGKK